jgi:acetaldehyde dehydrogenase/alcohol dehydrogenase
MASQAESLAAERIAYLDGLVRQAKAAAAAFADYTQQDVDRIVRPMVLAGQRQAQYLARLAVEETRLGVLEDKAIKNMVATEFVYNYVKDKRTVGVIREDAERNVVEIAEPIGVILSLLPITNPTSTALFKCIMAVKTRNALIFSAHPRSQRCSAEAARIMAETAVQAGAPEGFITWIDRPGLADTHHLMRHPDVRLIDATGGRNMVVAAYSSGKPALGVGPGNTPVYLEQSADLEMAVVDILTSKTFDNGTICAAEQTVVIDEAIYERALAAFAALGAHVCDQKEAELLANTLIDPQSGMLRPQAIGQSAADIAGYVGLAVAPQTKLLVAPILGVGREHPLSAEKLCPVLSVIPARSCDEALRLCLEVQMYGGAGHTAVIFSRNEDLIARFGRRMKAGRIIVNSPGSIGALGGVYNDMVPTFSFGCGTAGGNSTTDNVNVYHYLDIKRMARRTQAHQWFRVPNQIFFNRNSIENLRRIPSQATVIVTNPFLEQLGFVDVVRRHLPPQTHMHVLTIPDREPEPETIAQGVQTLRGFEADQIVALGGGSIIDAAKIMKLKYESPEADLAELAAPFLDIRKRVVEYPTEAQRSRRVCLIAVSTTSGTGSEVTPFAVMTSGRRKLTLADASLTPDVAIVDPQFVLSMPRSVTADTGVDCLTHAIEAGVSIYASPYTDSNALQALLLVFRYLPVAYEHPDNEAARTRMHNAASIAGIAFANASVGVNHALAHAVGARFGIAHGRANALLLPHVIAYNASVPTKFMPSPNVRGYVAHKKYALAADILGLGGRSVEEKVVRLIAAVEELLDRLGMPRSLAELGIDEERFRGEIPALVEIAFDDPSWRSNPRLPLLGELEGLLWQAWRGRTSSSGLLAQERKFE